MQELLKRKSILTAIGIAAVGLIWINLLYFPNNTKIEKLKSDMNALEQEIHTGQVLVTSTAQIANNVEIAHQEVKECLSGIISEDNVSGFIAQIENALKEYGMRDLKINPHLADLLHKPDIKLGDRRMKCIDLEVKGNGRYLDLGRFYEYLQRQPYFAGINMLDLSYNADLNPRIRFHFSFSAYLQQEENRG